MTRRDDEDETLGSFYMGRMRPPPKPARVLPRGWIATLTLAAFAAIIWYAYPQAEERYEDSDIPLIKADAAAYKFQPDDPGGMVIPHQDSTVFDPLDGRSGKTVERLLPQPEDPVDRESALGAPTPPRIIEGKPALNLEPQGGQIAAEVQSVPQDMPAVVPPAPKPAAAEAEKKAEEKPSTGGGTYIRLGSFRAESGVDTAWKELRAKHAGLLGKLGKRSQRVDLGAKGIFYRLEAGPVTEAEAKRICDTLKKSNGGCIVAR